MAAAEPALAKMSAVLIKAARQRSRFRPLTRRDLACRFHVVRAIALFFPINTVPCQQRSGPRNPRNSARRRATTTCFIPSIGPAHDLSGGPRRTRISGPRTDLPSCRLRGAHPHNRRPFPSITAARRSCKRHTRTAARPDGAFAGRRKFPALGKNISGACGKTRKAICGRCLGAIARHKPAPHSRSTMPRIVPEMPSDFRHSGAVNCPLAIEVQSDGCPARHGNIPTFPIDAQRVY
jgi:hypothetical protein